MSAEPKPPKYPILDDIEVPVNVLANWQVTADLLAEMAEAPAALIMRVHAREIEVFVASHSPGNVYHPGEKAPLDMGLYCETVMSTQRELQVPNALKDPAWDHNPDIELGMISYCGLPLTWPTGEIFGTICILDARENAYSNRTRQLMERFRDSIQFNLASIYESSLSGIRLGETENKLRDSESRSQRYLDTTQTVMLALDTKGCVSMINRAGQFLLGYTEAELFGRNWFAACLPQPEGMDVVYPVFLRFMAGELAAFAEYENDVLCQDGSRRLIGWRNTYFRDDEGRIVGALSSGEDITERKRAEVELEQHRHHLEALVEARTHELEQANSALGVEITKLKEAEESLDSFNRDFEAFLDQTTDFIYFKDINSRFRFCSRTLAAITGHAGWHEMIGKHDREVFPPEIAMIYEEEEIPVISEGRPLLNKIDPYYDTAGRLGYVLTNKWPLFDASGQVAGIFGISRDITERMQAEAALQEKTEALAQANADLLRSEQKFRGITENGPFAVVIFDPAQKTVYMNPMFEHMFGYTFEDIPSVEAWWPLAYPDEQFRNEVRQRWNSAVEEAIRHQSPMTPVEALVTCKDGNLRPVEIRMAPMGEISIVIFIDITERLAASQALKDAKIAAEAANQSKSDFLANMSHEIRTPLNAVLGMLYLALKDDLSPKLRNHLSKAQGAAQSLLCVINDILDFSKIEAGKLQIDQVEFGLDSVIEQLTDSISLQAEHKGIEFLIRYNADIPPVLIGDPLRLGQVLMNLCSNAVKFTETGEVELALRCLNATEAGATLQISVRDTGIGMTTEEQEKLFQKFSQADQSTTRRFGGTGLGLAISKLLVELMGGRIWIEDSQPGKGTTFCFTVQLKIATQAQAHRSMLLEQAGPLLRGIRVLVVDDNEAARIILAGMLHFFHLEVSVAANGSEAIRMLKNASGQPFDLVLMDWRMPDMNGDEVIRRIHADASLLQPKKIVMVTAYGREEVIRRADQAGVDGFLVKPVSPSTLLDTILSALGHPFIPGIGKPDEAGVEAGDSRNFSGARVLLVEDNEINCDFAAELLRSMNIVVDIAVDGAKAVAKVQQHDYDLVLMDIQMPVMDGLEAARRIRALAEQSGGERYATLPIIAMTALAMAQDEVKSRQAGMNDHITKPLDPERLEATLAKCLPAVKQTASMPIMAKASMADPPADLLALRSLDATQGIYRIGGKAESYRKQLRRFREHYAAAADELERLVAAQGLAAGEAYCHTLKGVSGSLGAHELFACASELNGFLNQGKLPEPAQFERLRHLLQEVTAEIDGLVASNVAPPTARAALGRDELRAKLAALSTLLETDMGAAELLLADLRSGVAGTEAEQAVLEIAVKMDVFAIDEALARITTLKRRLDGTA